MHGEFNILGEFYPFKKPETKKPSLHHCCCELVLTQKNVPSISLVKMAQGTFGEVQITNIEIKSDALLEGRWYIGRKIRQIGAEWAVHASCYLQKGITFYFNIGDLGFFLSHFY